MTTLRKGNCVARKKRQCKREEIQKYVTLRNFWTSTVQEAVEILDLYHFQQTYSHTALTIPKGKETAVYTSSAALWSGQGDSVQEKAQWVFLRDGEGNTYLCLQSDLTHKQMCRWMGWFRFPGTLVPYTVFYFPERTASPCTLEAPCAHQALVLWRNGLTSPVVKLDLPDLFRPI